MDASTRRPVIDPGTRVRADESAPGDAARPAPFVVERSNGGAARRRRPGAPAARGVRGGVKPRKSLDAVARLLTPTLVDATPGPLPRLQPAPDRQDIPARHAVARTLRDLPWTNIAVVGPRADLLIEWLRQIGHGADALALQPGEHGKRAPRRSRPSVVLAVECLERAPDIVLLLHDFKSMLAPEGLLVAVAPNLTHASVRLAMLRGDYPLLSSKADATRRAFTAAELEQLFENAGFTVLGIERELDQPDVLTRIGAGVPEAVLTMLADDREALTTHFVVLAGLRNRTVLGLVHRRIRDLAHQADTTAGTVDHLSRRMGELEAHGRPAATDDGSVPNLARALDQLPRRVAEIEHRIALTTQSELALRQAAEPLTAFSGELRSLVSHVDQMRYRRLLSRIKTTVARELPPGSTIAVISRGDPELLAFTGRRGCHFPQTERGIYAGHHPADSQAAIAQLDHVRARGAKYLLIPRTAFWWLDHYREFREHLVRRYRCVYRDAHTCALFELGRRRGRERMR